MLSTLFLSSGDLIADRRYAWAQDLESKGDLAGAADLLEQALELTPGYASAWFALGELREKLGDADAAAAAYRKAREADPDDRHGALVNLMRLKAAEPSGMPPAYVRTLFDHYAPDFDRSLTEGLNYSAPMLLLAGVEAAARDAGRAMHFAAMLDIGCGTGLAGAAFRAKVDALVGVDLSPRMIEQARQKNIYDRLEVGDLLEFLAAETHVGNSYDLILAADVFAYLPDLAPVARAVSAVLARGGLFAFSVESNDGEGVELGEALRFSHSAGHVRGALEGAGLKLLGLDSASTRTEKGFPVPGLIAVAVAKSE
ncbi:MAG TPA: methyltransferase [Xanthobacteraceae bacterium]|nr:methyltransferase [Xanthobacteraceae bacterium]